MKNILKSLLFIAFFIFAGCSIKPDTANSINRYLLSAPTIQSGTRIYNKTLKIALPKGPSFIFTDDIAYVKNGSIFGLYQYNKWEDIPAKRLQFIFSSVIRQSSLFQNVIISPTQIQNDFLLESKVDSFVYSFDSNSSYVNVAINLFLVDKSDKKVLKNKYLKVTKEVLRDNPKDVARGFSEAIEELSHKLILWLQQYE